MDASRRLRRVASNLPLLPLNRTRFAVPSPDPTPRRWETPMPRSFHWKWVGLLALTLSHTRQGQAFQWNGRISKSPKIGRIA